MEIRSATIFARPERFCCGHRWIDGKSMTSEPIASLPGDDVAVSLQEHIGVVENRRTPGNFFDVTPQDALCRRKILHIRAGRRPTSWRVAPSERIILLASKELAAN